ncbi:hypothetical protein [Variovorax guangxiensis]|uniref:hypothetical protein n=1 Tax=Variovorax guangxiensis TaxID=1775474 RepID=UPI0028675926|nr:hypothetical protein [Variovorax guangxiensis]MDR6857242.1 ABC-type glucose/galactose transport system permease subunit [Variovorax guangxiensis]
MKKLALVAVVALLGLVVFAATQLTLFVIQPIGMLPEGRTVLILRGDKNLNFIDSADAICERVSGGVSLICRSAALSAAINDTKILLRMPYSATLYGISTGGREYDR